MKKSIILITAVTIFSFLYGCASVRIYSDSDLKTKTGLKFYSAKPYLLVELKAEKDMTVKTTIVYLPDLSNPQYLNVKPGFGSNELKMAFTNGILNSYGLTNDAEADETISALAGLIAKSSDALRLESAPGIRPEKADGEAYFILYEIIITQDGTRLVRVGE